MPVKSIHKARLNALTSYLYFFLGAIITFVVSPYLVFYLGSNAFGILKSSQKILDFATVADGRPSQALKWVIANKQGDSNDVEKRQFVGCSLKVSFIFLPLLILVVAGLVYMLPEAINGLHKDQYNLVRFMGLVLGANIILGPLLAIPDSVLVGTNQGYRSTISRIFWLVFSNGLILYFAYLGYSLIAIASVILFAAIMNAFCVYMIAVKHVGWLGLDKPSDVQFKSFLRFSGWVLSWTFVSKILLSSELLLLGYLVGAEKVSSYVFSTYIIQLGLALALMTGGSLTPMMGGLLGEKKYEELKPLVEGFRELLLFVAVVIGGGVMSLNGSFVSLWVGEEYFLGSTVNALIVVAFFQLLLLRGEAQIQDLSLNIRSKVLMGVCGSVISVALAIVLYWLFKDIGFIFIGVITGRILMTLSFPVMVNKIVGGKGYPLSKVVVAIMMLIVCYIIGQNLLLHSWLYFLLSFMVIAGGLVITGYLLLLSNSAKSLLRVRNI